MDIENMNGDLKKVLKNKAIFISVVCRDIWPNAKVPFSMLDYRLANPQAWQPHELEYFATVYDRAKKDPEKYLNRSEIAALMWPLLKRKMAGQYLYYRLKRKGFLLQAEKKLYNKAVETLLSK